MERNRSVWRGARPSAVAGDDLIIAFVRACGCEEAEAERWVQVRQRIAGQAESPESSPGGLTEPQPALAGHRGVLITGISAVAVAAIAGLVTVIVVVLGTGSEERSPLPQRSQASHDGDVAWTNTARTRVGVNDRTDDGQVVSAEYVTDQGFAGVVTDTNGSKPGHGATAIPVGHIVVKLRVCRQNTSYGAWYDA